MSLNLEGGVVATVDAAVEIELVENAWAHSFDVLTHKEIDRIRCRAKYVDLSAEWNPSLGHCLGNVVRQAGGMGPSRYSVLAWPLCRRDVQNLA